MSSLNIDKSTNLTSDVYGLNAYVNEIKKRFTPEVKEDTLMLGIFGYTGQVFSDLLQNTVVMASEFSNESIPTKAKFEKNIIAHALGLGITDINAVPAQLDVLLTFVEDDIINWLGARDADGNDLPWDGDGFIFDSDTPIHIGDFTFYADYDIQIKKIKINNEGKKDKFTYTAKYLIGIKNPVSDITNPYLTPPVKMNVNGTNIIFTKVTLRQISKEVIHKKVLSDNTIASKTVTFDFEGQLAAFTIDVAEGTKTTHLIPTYEGLSISDREYPYFYYSFLDSNTIRIKFDRYSYAPRINSDVSINIYTTEGESGNFTFNPEVYPGFAFASDKYGYSNIGCEIRPITGESMYGTNKKSVEDLKKVIPKEALSRGSITNLADLENFFNMLNTDNSKLYFYKKRDNALERLYYSFILMRDAYNVIIPTNTIDICVDENQLQQESGSGKLVFKKGQMIKLDGDKGIIYNKSDDEEIDYDENFMYVIPYNFIINKSPLYGMYYLSTIDAKKFLNFSFISSSCLYQYIATSISWYRGYLENPNTYEMNIAIEQNIDEDEDFKMIQYDTDGNIKKVNIRCIAVFYNDEGNPHRWAEAELVDFDKAANIFYYRFKFTTEDYIDSKNRIRIDTGLYDLKSLNESYAHLKSNTKCEIHIITKQGNSTDMDKLKDILPDFTMQAEDSKGNLLFEDKNNKQAYKDGTGYHYTDGSGDINIDENPLTPVMTSDPLSSYSLSNSYEVMDGVDFFYDYSEIIDSTVISEIDEDDKSHQYYRIKAVPVVKYNYFETEDRVINFCNELVKRKKYIDYAVTVLEDAFGMDFKFFNTYGPSKLFTIDGNTEYINRTNLSITFRIKLNPNYDTNIINDIINDIKAYIEDINEISSIHMPNLVTEITNKYRESIVYFEFVDINGYGPSVQHIYAMNMPDEVMVPEFINITSLDTGAPDITLLMA